MEAGKANSERMVVPILSLRMRRDVIETMNRGPNTEIVRPVVEQYFITPNGSRGGRATERLSFVEAINRMSF